MKTYSIEIQRISYSYITIEIQADNVKTANELALDEAGDHEYNESEAEYKIVLNNCLYKYSSQS